MNVDVAVIGAGPAGSVASRMLSQRGYSVMLIDPLSDGPRIGESLSGSARPLLRDMGLLPWLDRSMPNACVGNLSAWGGPELHNRDAIYDPHGAGWHLDRSRFDNCLREAAFETGVQWWPERLAQVQRTPGNWRLRFPDKQLNARWLIDASGRASILARRLGVRRIKDQPMIAVYAKAACTDNDQRTLIESVRQGWWYSAQLPEGRRIVALHTVARQAEVIQGSHHAWLHQLRATCHLRSMCELDQWEKPRACDASGSRLQLWAGDGWLAVGDAALAFDPLSSQGIFNACYTGMRGAQAVERALNNTPGWADGYIGQLQSIRQTYLEHLRYYYRSEMRWPDEDFWRVRR